MKYLGTRTKPYNPVVTQDIDDKEDAISSTGLTTLIEDTDCLVTYKTQSRKTWRIRWSEIKSKIETFIRAAFKTTPLPLDSGGTGATTAAAARSNLGITPANIGALPTAAGAVGTNNLADGAVTAQKLAADAVKLTFTDTVVQTGQWVGDATYENFPFRALIGLSDAVTAAMVPEVIFNAPEAASGIFAPVTQSTGGGIMLYVSEIPSAAITIPTIILWR